jgi:hypothetical protein
MILTAETPMNFKRTFDANISSSACATPRSVPMIIAVVAEGMFRFTFLHFATSFLLTVVTEGDLLAVALDFNANYRRK